jgi:hypothetical protein
MSICETSSQRVRYGADERNDAQDSGYFGAGPFKRGRQGNQERAENGIDSWRYADHIANRCTGKYRQATVSQVHSQPASKQLDSTICSPDLK